jgi:hypothetical protein
MIKAGVRYTVRYYSRIPDPAHVLSARGLARGKERKAALLKKYNRMLHLIVVNTLGPSVKKSIKGLFVHSFLYSFILLVRLLKQFL